MGFAPNAAFVPTNIAFGFDCSDMTAVAFLPGVNTLQLSASTTPTPDIIALSATTTHDGIVDLSGPDGANGFAIATANVGASATVTASATIGAADLPVAISLCQTESSTGACMTAPATSVTAMITANATPTFSVFVQGSGTVPFQPAANRIFVQFEDAGGAIRGSTSVAVRTQ